ncbi:sulfotransferase 1A2-like [Culicoides brevitarsis]|uniref:sulfotransferase 1A2-like n=1 Tax=Culicoides brevitarsis TaxID=469753 RepID=UPI00307B227E
MSYKVHEIIKEASSGFEKNFHTQFKYILNEFNEEIDPKICTLIKKYNTVQLPKAFEKYLEQIRALEVFEDDIWVITYPKCGTTWSQEAIWQICNGVDIDEKGKISIRNRFPFLEIQAVAADPTNESEFEIIQKLERPRFIKSHLPLAFLPNALWNVKPKIIYVTREAKDAAVSYFHHYYNLYNYSGTKENFMELFLNGNVEYGDYWDHLHQFLSLKSVYPNMELIKFEDLKHNMDSVLTQLCNFLDKKLSPEKLSILKQHLQFDSMKANPAINPPHLKILVQKQRPGSEYTFLRRGQTGSHKDEMPPEFVDKFDEKTRKRLEGLQ